MKRVFLWIVIISILTLPVAAQLTPAIIYKESSSGVVLIKTNQGTGSGFLVSTDGLIATCFHVINGVKSVEVKTFSGEIYDDIYLVAKDERKDIAIIKINGFDLKHLNLGNSNEVSPGEKVITIGNPMGLQELQASITDGVISGIRDTGEGYNVIQISSPISPGNSGGPVFSEKGSVIGIAAFKLRGGENLNFAIPINYLRGLLSAPVQSPIAHWSTGTSEREIYTQKRKFSLSGNWKSTNGDLIQIKEDADHIIILNITSPKLTYVFRRQDDLLIGRVYNQGANFWGLTPPEGRVIKPVDNLELVYSGFKAKESESKEIILEKAKKALISPWAKWIRID